jgi:hypothetical protein
LWSPTTLNSNSAYSIAYPPGHVFVMTASIAHRGK